MKYRFILNFLIFTTPWFVWLSGLVSYYSDYAQVLITSSPKTGEVYDFIVVGSGSAGAVVARRLATVPTTKVLLLEAGGDPGFLNAVPGLALSLSDYSETDWRFRTVPQKNACYGLKNNESMWTTGRVLGGSTTLNFMMYLRGNRKDYNNWASLTQDKEWGYDSVLKYFKKSIKSYNGVGKSNKKHYSESPYGYLNIEDRAWKTLYQEFAETGRNAGYPTLDVNGEIQGPGIGVIEATQKRGERWGTYAAILRDLEKRPNVKISRYSEAIKVKLDRNNRAEGVWYLHHGTKKLALASREVIISAGSVNSPKILMLSGIGRKDHLSSLGIPTKIDLPVGDNLHDHILVPIFPFLVKKEGASFVMDRDTSPGAIYEFATTGNGFFTTPNGLHSQFFYTTKKTGEVDGTAWPDIQSFFAPAGPFAKFTQEFCRGTNVREDILESIIRPFEGKDGLVLLVGLVRPKSRGTLRLRGKDPLATPLIDPRYLEDSADMEALIEAIMKKVELLESTEPFKSLGVTLPRVPLKGCENHVIRSKAYWECYIRHLTLTIWHPAGTCRMGTVKDKRSVVDSKLRVLNTQNLRVIDASVMPVVVNANTMAPTMMIGEKGSDFIREHWSQQLLVCDFRHHVFNSFKDAKCFYSLLM